MVQANITYLKVFGNVSNSSRAVCEKFR